MLYEFTIERSRYLIQNIKAFYHSEYIGYRKPGNPDYINICKNTYGSSSELNSATQELKNVLFKDLPEVMRLLPYDSLTVCVVPRAKAEISYKANQLLFKVTVRNVVNQLNDYYDGADFIHRHTDTKTTHLQGAIENGKMQNYDNKGDMPYPGITKATCDISSDVKGKDILLIDDLYTRTVNIDEDAIQALLDNGAHSVTFYTIGRTVRSGY